MKKLLLLMCSLGSLLVSVAAHAAGTFTLSPSIITNDYEGSITLNITGLGLGQSVVIKRFGDLQSNGLVQASSPLLLDFTVTDGQVPLISGVRNPNVPGDEDGLTNGQIQVRLPFPTLDPTVFPAAIRSIFQVSAPGGGFTTTNLPFTIVQKVYPQGVTGRLTALTTNGSQLPYTLVGLGSAFNNLPGSQFTVTDTNGYFTIYALPGIYTVQIAVVSGFAGDQSLTVTVPCGQMVTDNVAVPAAGLTLSGKVTDAGTGKGIPGVAVTAKTTNNLNVATFTDTNGNYTLPVIPTNVWRVRVYQAMLSQAGYVALANRTNVNVGNLNVSGINFSFSKATALIHGTITDDSGNPVIGTEVMGGDAAAPQHEADGASFAPDGSYALGVIGGSWTLGQAPDQLALFGLTAAGTNVTLADGQVMQANLVDVRTNFPTLSSPSHPSAGQAQFFLNGLGAQKYLIQYSTNLGSSNWSSFLTTNGGCAPVTIIDSNASNAARYYRAVIAP